MPISDSDDPDRAVIAQQPENNHNHNYSNNDNNNNKHSGIDRAGTAKARERTTRKLILGEVSRTNIDKQQNIDNKP